MNFCFSINKWWINEQIRWGSRFLLIDCPCRLTDQDQAPVYITNWKQLAQARYHQRFTWELKLFKVKLFQVHSFTFDRESVPPGSMIFPFPRLLKGIKTLSWQSRVSRATYCCRCNYLPAIGWGARVPAFKASHSTLSAFRGRFETWCVGDNELFPAEEEGCWSTSAQDLRRLELF